MPPIDSSMTNAAHTGAAYDLGDIIATIASAQIGEKVFVGWTAAYAGILESGWSKQAPSGFVRLAVMQWSQTVSETVSEAKSRAG